MILLGIVEGWAPCLLILVLTNSLDTIERQAEWMLSESHLYKRFSNSQCLPEPTLIFSSSKDHCVSHPELSAQRCSLTSKHMQYQPGVERQLLVQCLLCKREDLNLYSQHPHKTQVWLHTPVSSPVLGIKRAIPWELASQPVSLAECSGLARDPLRKWGGGERWLPWCGSSTGPCSTTWDLMIQAESV